MTARRSLLALALAATACTTGSSPESSVPASIGNATQSAAPATGVVCEWYSTIDRDPSQVVHGAPDFGNPPNEDSPSELMAQAYGAQLRLDYGMPTDDDPARLMRQLIDKLEDMAGRASGEEREDLVALADRLDEMALTGDLTDLLDATEGFHLKYLEECGAHLTNE